MLNPDKVLVKFLKCEMKGRITGSVFFIIIGVFIDLVFELDTQSMM